MYDIVRKFSSGKKISFSSVGENKIHLESEKSVFNLNQFMKLIQFINLNQFIKLNQILKLNHSSPNSLSCKGFLRGRKRGLGQSCAAAGSRLHGSLMDP